MFSKASIVALLASVAAAQHAPVGEPAGNPITRPLNEVVPACKAFSITWEPTTTNTVSLILLRGPSSNVVPLGAPLAVGIPNSGSFTWTPSSELEADETHYGLQLIDDVNGQYQYSTQFGISKADCGAVSSKPAPKPEPTPSATAPRSASVSEGYGEGYPVPSSSAVKPASSSSVAEPSSIPAASTLVPYPTGTPIKSVGTSSHVASTGKPAQSTMIIQPTGSMTVPESLRASATGTSSATLPESTGAAAGLKAGLGLVGAAAAAVLMF